MEIRYLRTLGIEFGRRVKSYIGMSGVEELLYIGVVDFATLGLTVRTVGADGFNHAVVHAETLIDSDSEPVESLQNILLCTGYEARAVRIFDTQEHVTAVLAGKKIIIQGGTDTTDMQRARR